MPFHSETIVACFQRCVPLSIVFCRLNGYTFFAIVLTVCFCVLYVECGFLLCGFLWEFLVIFHYRVLDSLCLHNRCLWLMSRLDFLNMIDLFEKCILPNTSFHVTVYKAHFIILLIKHIAKIHQLSE